MKRLLFLVLSLVVLWCGKAQAVEPYLYAGGKYGIAFFDVSQFDDGHVYSGFVGYQIYDHFSVEGEMGRFRDGGDKLDGGYEAVYGVAMVYGDLLYGKFKAGLLYESLDVSSRFGKLTDSDLGLSYGIGCGVFLLRSSLDFEITLLDKDFYVMTGGFTVEF